MDFDDLDDVAPVVENRQPPTGTVLSWMRRSNRVPGLSTHMHLLPEMLQKQVPPHVRASISKGERREPAAKVRLLCVHGVADSYKQDWFLLEAEAPDEIEVAVHEFPGHGHREKEQILSSVGELADDAFEAFKEYMETGSFALLGHSIGCLVITEVAKRAEAQLNVKPVAVFMVERGACQWPLFTAKGIEGLRDKELAVTLETKREAEATGEPAFDTREKEMEDGQAVLIVSSTSGELIDSWNASSPSQAIVLYDEIVQVNGVKGVPGKLRAELDQTIRSGGELRLELRRRPYEFFAIYQPDVFRMLQNGPTRALDRWQRSWRCENDNMEVGYHTFACPLIALSADGSVECTVSLKDHPKETRAVIDYGGKTFNTEVGDGKAFFGHFPRETFNDWASWTENKAGFKVVECLDCNHMSIKANKLFKDTVYGTLSDLVKLWSRA